MIGWENPTDMLGGNLLSVREFWASKAKVPWLRQKVVKTVRLNYDSVWAAILKRPAQ